MRGILPPTHACPSTALGVATILALSLSLTGCGDGGGGGGSDRANPDGGATSSGGTGADPGTTGGDTSGTTGGGSTGGATDGGSTGGGTGGGTTTGGSGSTTGGSTGSTTGGSTGGGTTTGGTTGGSEPPRTGDSVMLADFEDGRINREFNFFVANQYNPLGRYTWSVDSQGANGTSRSLKLHVTSGTPYFYFDPQHGGGRVRYLAEGKNVNRLGFYLKLPRGWGQNNQYVNMHIGWYLSNDPTRNETNNGHFYHHMYVVPGTDWFHVVVGNNYDWQRDRGSSSFDPGRSMHLTAFNAFFPKVTRFYITGAPNPGTSSWAPTPYDMWIDEIEMFHVDEEIRVSQGLVRSSRGTRTTITVYNQTFEDATYDIRVSNLDGKGVDVIDESGAAITSLTLPGGRTRQIRVSPRGAGTSNVVLYKRGEPRNPHVQIRTPYSGYRQDYDNPGAAILVVGS